jgi:hypothetical protein
MATCPRCKGFLDEDHVCPAQWGRTLRWGASLTVGLIIGAIAGGTVFSVVGSVLHVPGFEAFGVVAGTLTVFVIMRSIRQW